MIYFICFCNFYIEIEINNELSQNVLYIYIYIYINVCVCMMIKAHKTITTFSSSISRIYDHQQCVYTPTETHPFSLNIYNSAVHFVSIINLCTINIFVLWEENSVWVVDDCSSEYSFQFQASKQNQNNNVYFANHFTKILNEKTCLFSLNHSSQTLSVHLITQLPSLQIHKGQLKTLGY